MMVSPSVRVSDIPQNVMYVRMRQANTPVILLLFSFYSSLLSAAGSDQVL